jgi:putative flippase GtrA
VIGVTGVFITNAVYDLLFIHLGVGPVTSTIAATIATIAAAIATYLGNRCWSFRTRQRTGVVREISVFAVLNSIGLLIQDVTVAFNYYLLHLGHDKLAGLVALNAGIALATLFRFWSYRRFVWVTSRADGDAKRANGPSMAVRSPLPPPPFASDARRRRWW